MSRLIDRRRFSLPRSRGAPAPSSQPAFPGWIIFACFVVAYAAVTWPALAHAWWYTDDLVFADPGCSAQRMLSQPKANGRLVQGVWLLTFLPEQGPRADDWNRAWRGLQVAFHALTATLIAWAFWRVAPGWAAILAALPFLLWSLSGEPVLWRSAGIYPLGALIGMLALVALCARPRRRAARLALGALGVGLAVLAPLSSQSAAMAPIVVIAIMAALLILRSERARLRPLAANAALLMGGLLVGAAISVWVGHSGGRMELAGGLRERLAYLAQINQLVLRFPPAFPSALAAAQLTIVGGAFGLVGLRLGPGQRRSGALPPRAGGPRSPCGPEAHAPPVGWGIVALSVLALLFALPHGPAVAAAERWASLRVLYLGPLALCGCWLALRELLRGSRIGGALAVVLLAVTVALHVPILHRFAADRVALFRADLRVLDELAAAAARHQTARVCVVTHPRLRVWNWNPHGLAFEHCDATYSALQISWSDGQFIRRFSGLEPVESAAALAQAAAICNGRKPPLRFETYYLPEFDAVCLCPP